MDEEKETKDKERDTKERKFPLRLVVLLAIIIGASGGGYLAYAKYLSPQPEEKGAKQAAVTGATESGKGGEIGPMYKLAPFIVNLADEGGRRYLKTTIELEMGDEKMRPELDKKQPLVRDAILVLLSSKTFAQVSDGQGKTTLRGEMTSKLASLISTGTVKEVYFTEFVVQ